MKKNLANLFKVKTIISLTVVFTSCYLTIIDKMDIATFSAFVGSIITYYFNKKEKSDEE